MLLYFDISNNEQQLPGNKMCSTKWKHKNVSNNLQHDKRIKRITDKFIVFEILFILAVNNRPAQEQFKLL